MTPRAPAAAVLEGQHLDVATAAEIEGLRCLVCGSATRAAVDRDVRWCARCGYWGVSTAPGAGETSGTSLDEQRRAAGLAATRRVGARNALRLLARHRRLVGARLCDVGCGYGWFLEAAAAEGMTVLGIEPDDIVAHAARTRGLDVRGGPFPHVLGPREQFDVIAFHDVLEHLPDVEATLAAARARLVPDGLLLISVPSSGGLYFGVARRLRALGFRAAWDRLWQRRFPSPHLHFFGADNLARLVERNGFALRESAALPMVELRGLWRRARMDRHLAVVTALVGVALVVLAHALRSFLPADAIVQVYARRSGPGREMESWIRQRLRAE